MKIKSVFVVCSFVLCFGAIGCQDGAVNPVETEDTPTTGTLVTASPTPIETGFNVSVPAPVLAPTP